MTCLHGPLDGFECPPGLIRNSRAILGLKIIYANEEWPYLSGEPATYRNDAHVVYVIQDARLEYRETRR